MKAKPKKQAVKRPRNKTISLDPEVKIMLENLAKKNHTSVSGWITMKVIEAKKSLPLDPANYTYEDPDAAQSKHLASLPDNTQKIQNHA